MSTILFTKQALNNTANYIFITTKRYGQLCAQLVHQCSWQQLSLSSLACSQVNQSKYENYENEGAMGGHDGLLA